MSSGPTWELCKENAAPLERGRNVESLSRALAPDSVVKASSARREDDPEIQQFESLVRPMEKFSELYAKLNSRNDDVDVNKVLKGSRLDKEKDPLVHWLRYIKYNEDTYPADTRNQFLIMERCTRTLLHHPNYVDDSRYIRVCVLYADRTSSPNEIFKLMHQNKIGANVAMFWLAWAWVAEKKKDFQFAEKIFRKAISKKAKPSKLLQQRYKQFQRRMSRHWLNYNADQQRQPGGNDLENDEEEYLEQQHHRGALGGLTEEGVRYNQRSRSANAMAAHGGVHGTSQNRANDENINRPNTLQEPSSTAAFTSRNNSTRTHSNNGRNNNNIASSGGAFSIFVEDTENEDDHYNLNQSTVYDDNRQFPKRQLVREDEQRKENTLQAERWNQRGGLHSGPEQLEPAYEPGANVPTITQRWGQSVDIQMNVGPASQPAFQVFVDEEYVNDNNDNEMKSEQHIGNTRSLRERLGDGDMAEKLSRDPLRYVLNPSKLTSDKLKTMKQEDARLRTSNEKNDNFERMNEQNKINDMNDKQLNPKKSGKRVNSEKNNSKVSCGFDKKLLAKDDYGKECCFEEARAKVGYFTILSNEYNFNLLSSETSMQTASSLMDLEVTMDDDVEMDQESSVDMISSENYQQNTNTHMKAALNATTLHGPKSGESPVKAPMPRRVLFALDTSTCNTSKNNQNASIASSTLDEQDAVGVRGTEETINTKLAMRELSVMFSSPADGTQRDETEAQPLSSKKPLFSIYSGKSNVPEPLTSSTKYIEESIYEPENEYDENAENKCPTNRNARTNRTRGFNDCAMRELNQADLEEEKEEEEHARRALRERNDYDVNESHGFEIYVDENSDDVNQMPVEHKTQEVFTIHEEKTDFLEGSKRSEERMTHVKEAGFMIFEDDKIDTDKACGEDEKEHTATLSIFEDMAEDLEFTQETGKVDGNTVEHSTINQSKNPGFSIFVDETVSGGDHEKNGTILTEEIAAFGNLSLIAPSENDTQIDLESKFKKRKDKNETSPNLNRPRSTQTIIDYDCLYEKNLTVGMDEAMDEASQQASRKRIVSNDTLEWENVFEEEIPVYDRRSLTLPKGLRRTPKKGTEMDMGEYSLRVKYELGRGVYGIVVLCDCRTISSKADTSPIALKVQSPTGCLAWEHSILKLLAERVSKKMGVGAFAKRRRRSMMPPELKEISTKEEYPFPKALSFAVFSDGAVLGMTAGSMSGCTLIDVVNTHQGSVPELIAIHYTSRMLLHLETLHWHGKILHCDVKPDNWVLTSSNTVNEMTSSSTVPGSDLMLVDYGRSIDLAALTAKGTDPFDIQLTGSVAAEDMECVAMREKMPWGTDIDTFGLCASAHVLLYGSHIEIEKVNSKWSLKKKLRRYWQKELWQKLFDTLINLDSNGRSSGSHPNSLRAIRKSFEEHLAEGNRMKQIESLLKNQDRLMPSQR